MANSKFITPSTYSDGFYMYEVGLPAEIMTKLRAGDIKLCDAVFPTNLHEGDFIAVLAGNPYPRENYPTLADMGKFVVYVSYVLSGDDGLGMSQTYALSCQDGSGLEKGVFRQICECDESMVLETDPAFVQRNLTGDAPLLGNRLCVVSQSSDLQQIEVLGTYGDERYVVPARGSVAVCPPGDRTCFDLTEFVESHPEGSPVQFLYLDGTSLHTIQWAPAGTSVSQVEFRPEEEVDVQTTITLDTGRWIEMYSAKIRSYFGGRVKTMTVSDIANDFTGLVLPAAKQITVTNSGDEDVEFSI